MNGYDDEEYVRELEEIFPEEALEAVRNVKDLDNHHQRLRWLIDHHWFDLWRYWRSKGGPVSAYLVKNYILDHVKLMNKKDVFKGHATFPWEKSHEF